MALIGHVIAMTGVAFVISGNGTKRELHLGDSIETGDTIQTPAGVQVDLDLASGRPLHINPEQLVAFTPELSEVFVPDGLDSAINLATIDTVIKAIEEGKDINAVLEDTAAGAGGATSEGFGFVDLLRIDDDLNNFRFSYEYGVSDRVEIDPTVVYNDNGVAIPDSIIGDTEAPNLVAQTFAYAENQIAGATVANVVASDNTGVTSFVFTATGTNTSLDGYYQIDNSGVITLTASGAASAVNDFEAGTNTGVYSVTASDADGNTTAANITLNELNVNEVPIAVSDTYMMLEDGDPITLLPLTADIDPDGTTPTIQSINGTLLTPGVAQVIVVTGGVVNINAAGAMTFTPELNFNGAVSFPYVITDGTVTSTANQTITVTAVNDAPVVNADNFTAVEGTVSILGNVLANDTDVEGAALSVGQFATNTSGAGAIVANGTNSITTALGGTVIMNANGTFTYTAPASRIHNDLTPDVDSFAYRASDSADVSGWTTVSINLADTSPVAHDDVDSLSASSIITGNVITGAGGTVIGGADSIGADAVAITNVVLTQGAQLSNTVGVGNVRTIVTTNGTLVIDQNDGNYTYTANPITKSVSAGTSSANQSVWTSAGINTYGYDNGGSELHDPYIGGTPVNGLDISGALNITQSQNVTYNNSNGTSADGLGVRDSGTGSNTSTSSISGAEHLLLDIGMTTNSATVTLTSLGNGEVATWYAFASDGSYIATGDVNGNASNTATVNIAPIGSFAYLAFTTSGSSFYVDGLTATSIIETPDIFTYTLTDADGSASSATLTINPGIAPVIDLDLSSAGTGFAATFIQNGAAVSIADTDINISDADSSNITHATITLCNALAGDVLAAGSMPVGITASVTGNVVTLTGSASFASYQTAIRAITFSTTSVDDTPREVDVVVTDGTNNSNTATATVAVVVNAPLIDLDASAVGTGFATHYLASGAAASIADTDISITDIDSSNVTGAVITLTNMQTGDVLAAGTMPSGIAASVVGNVVTLSGSATLADYQTAIQAVTFSNNAVNPVEITRIINVVVTDGTNNSNTATTEITIVPTGSNNTGYEDASYIPVTLTHPDSGETATSFNLSNLPANGALYLDAAMTILVTTGTDISVAGNGFVTLYFKPMADFNSGAFAGLGTPNFDFTAKNGVGDISSVATETITVTAVDDGLPDTVSDSFTTALGAAPITFTSAQLLANDTLFDHARITATGALPAGLTYDAGTDTYTYTPVAAGLATFTYTVTDDEGQTDTATVNLTTLNAGTDLAAVDESALMGGTGGGVAVVTGNLFTNDVGNTSISSINGVASVGGYITVNTAYGTLVVDSTGVGAGNYTYTLNNHVDNDTQAGADTNAYVETFTYVGNAATSSLVVTIKDDVPTVQDAVVQVRQGALPDTNLVFVIDVSGSMAGEVKNVASDGTVTIMDRLDATKLAVAAVINEYFSQGGNISIKLVSFSGTATLLNGGIAYTNASDAIAAVNGLAQGGSTNYEDALLDAMTAFTMDGPVNTAENNTIYFISDGVPTTGDMTDPGASIASGGNGYRDFVNANGIKSYAVGIGTGIADTTELDNIHTVDSDYSSVKDAAIIVTNVAALDEVLLASVPTSFGGSVVGTAANSSLIFGADGGYISSLIMKLDTNGDSTPDTDVTFTYNIGTNQISVVGSFPATGFPLAGDAITLNAGNGFADGILIFNFTTGEYVYQTAGFATEGEQFDIKFTATDGDGDIVAGKQTIQIVDAKPHAVNDVDTLASNANFFEGNVISAIGTDGGDSLQLTSFSTGRSGEDDPGDDGSVSTIVFKGVTFDLTTLTGATVALGGTYTVTSIAGVNTLTWVASSGGSSLVFNEEGYYKYTPPAAEISSNTVGPSVNYLLTNASLINTAATAGMTLTGIARTSAVEGSATIGVSGSGAGVTGNDSTRVDALESLVITFDAALHPHGVQDVIIDLNNANSNLSGSNALNYSIYNVHGDLLGQFSSNSEAPINMGYAGIGKIVIDSGGFGNPYGTVEDISYSTILATAATLAPAPEVIAYTITDTDGDTSSATLTLNNIIDEIAGTSANNTITGSASNEYISGLGGDDIIDAGAGFDLVRGGDGNDVIGGGADDDQLYGEDGNDTISGGTGNDLIYGDAGDDTLLGNDGNDYISGGAGSDVIIGGAGADIILGGAANDTLTGGIGGFDGESDTFKWELADKGVTGTPASDIITDFNVAPVASGGDVLDLRDLLVGENHDVGVGNLASYLHFEKSGADTIVHVSSNGDFAAGFNATKDVQTITLQNVDLVGSFTNDQQIVQDLLNNQKIITD